MHRVLSVDLAYKSACDLGICLLEQTGHASIGVSFIPFWRLGIENPPKPKQLANAIYGFCQNKGVSVVMLDGPQGWKDRSSNLQEMRLCEKQVLTPAKTGPVGHVKPKNYAPFVKFSIDTFAELVKLGALLLQEPAMTIPAKCLLALESFPMSAWQKLSIKPLPAKRKARPADLSERLRKLQNLFGLHVDRKPNHDESQALVSGLAGMAILGGNTAGYRAQGTGPKKQGGAVVEGFIVNPCRPEPNRS